MTHFQNIALLLLLIATSFSCTKAIIDDGSTDPDPITRAIKYSPDVERIMTDRCVTCHSGNAPSAGADLTTYENVRYYAEEKNLIERINDVAAPMPPDALMTADLRAQIEKWKTDGFPQ